MSLQLYAGVDAGGTSTRCVIADASGALVGLGQDGPGNATLAGRSVALSSIRAALSEALSAAPHARIVHLHVAAAGTLVPEEVGDLAASWSSGNDAPAAFAGALIDGPGLIVIAGTGSACYGQDGRGRTALQGGWGPLAGDEGSAYAIGCAGLRHLACALDGRVAPTLLSGALQDYLGVNSRESLLARLYIPTLPRDEVASLASLVTQTAQHGDRQAIRVLAQSGYDLGRAAAAMAGTLGLAGADARVATLGGVFAAGSLVLAPFRRRLRCIVPGARVIPARFPPVIGALLLAYRHAGVEEDALLLARLADGLH